MKRKALRNTRRGESSAESPSQLPQCQASPFKLEPIRKEVEQVFAAQPAIGKYLRGPRPRPEITAHELLICQLYVSLDGPILSLPIVTRSQLLAEEKAVRTDFGDPANARREQGQLVRLLARGIKDLAKMAASADSAAKFAAIVRFVVVHNCLEAARRSIENAATEILKKPDGPSVWNLVVKGRPDLIRLKRHLLKHGGKTFQRNDWVALQVSAGFCKRLREEGQFMPGQKATLVRMGRSACHENARKLAARKGVELWTGFALTGSVWALHSWCLQKTRLLETTSRRDLYFGVQLQYPFRDFLTHNFRASSWSAPF